MKKLPKLELRLFENTIKELIELEVGSFFEKKEIEGFEVKIDSISYTMIKNTEISQKSGQPITYGLAIAYRSYFKK